MAQGTYAIRRANPRYPFCADAEITLSDGTWLPAQLSEISCRGCYVDSLEPIPVGTEFHLSISDPLSTCELEGKVIYEHTGGGLGITGMGVLFRDVAPEQHIVLDTWLDQLAGNRPGPFAANFAAPSPA
jgi:hypothetical protein